MKEHRVQYLQVQLSILGFNREEISNKFEALRKLRKPAEETWNIARDCINRLKQEQCDSRNDKIING